MKEYLVGIDIGFCSTKIVVLENDRIIYKKNLEQNSNVFHLFKEIIYGAKNILLNKKFKIALTGSATTEIVKKLKLPFIQEVIASNTAVRSLIPQTEIAIELGGETAKITYFDNLESKITTIFSSETAIFIDKMAAFLNTDSKGLNELAQRAKEVYPITARCSSFAKNDIKILLNQGIEKEDIAASILQAVVDLTISKLIDVKRVNKNVVFLGITFIRLSELKKRFIDSLNISPDEVISPPDTEYYSAIGAALHARKFKEMDGEPLFKKLLDYQLLEKKITKHLAPLFKSSKEVTTFLTRVEKLKIKKIDIKSYSGDAYLGIDVGNTTVKIVLINQNGEIIFQNYTKIGDFSLDTVIAGLKKLNSEITPRINIVNSVVIGKEAQLIKNALDIDEVMFEEEALLKSTDGFSGDIDYILNVGGKTAKVIKITDNRVFSVKTNDTCSSYGGVFLEELYQKLNVDPNEVSKLMIEGTRNPLQLGNSCPVHLDTKLKSYQTEKIAKADILAGTSIALAKNILLDLIDSECIKNSNKKIVVAGGVFNNLIFLKEIERILDAQVIKTDISEYMGAYGAALTTIETATNKRSSIILKDIANLEYQLKKHICDKCSYHCLITEHDFSTGNVYISGNRCQKGLTLFATIEEKEKLPNLFEYKYNKIFDYHSLPQENAERGIIGIPRILNIYEHYPLWHTFLTKLKFTVVLSNETINSDFNNKEFESLCPPIKTSYQHVKSLLDQGIKKIFYPSIKYNSKEANEIVKQHNCPAIVTYLEMLTNNFDFEDDVLLINPSLNLEFSKGAIINLHKEFEKLGLKIDKQEIKVAFQAGIKKLAAFKKDIENKGKETVAYLEENDLKGIVLAAKPYYLDPNLNHKIDCLITDYGYALLTADSVGNLNQSRKLVSNKNQWSYLTNLEKAAEYVSKSKSLDFVQITSFKCGLDQQFTERAKTILAKNNKTYTQIELNEITDLEIIKDKLHYLAESKNRPFTKEKEVTKYQKFNKKTHTILTPLISPTHFQFFHTACKNAGYNLTTLTHIDKKTIETGMENVPKNASISTVIIVGQIIEALKSKRFYLEKTVIVIPEISNECLTNQDIDLLENALKNNGFNIPLLRLNFLNLDNQSNFKLSDIAIRNLLASIILGDLLTNVLYRTRPYEVNEGSTNQLYDKYVMKIKDMLENFDLINYKKLVDKLVDDFESLPVNNKNKPKIGLTGDLILQHHPIANNNLVNLLENEGAEVVPSHLINYLLIAINNTQNLQNEHISEKNIDKFSFKLVFNYINKYLTVVSERLNKSENFKNILEIEQLITNNKKYISSTGHYNNEWGITSDIVNCLETGINNIIYVDKLTCLPNLNPNIGIENKFKKDYPNINLHYLNYDFKLNNTSRKNKIKMVVEIAKKEKENVSSRNKN